jgi:hypothetical protein
MVIFVVAYVRIQRDGDFVSVNYDNICVSCLA